jgi:SAM-dependent methyltransferase
MVRTAENDNVIVPQQVANPRVLRAPAVRAALLQVLAAAPTLGGVYVLARAHHPLPLYGAALLQGALAALLTYAWRLAPWWCWIQLLFPVALVSADKLHLPAGVLLGVFLFLLLLFWSTFRTQVPFYPSGPAVWRAVAGLLPPDRPVRLIDIGSGLGGLVLDLARRNPASNLSGIELAPLPWLLSVLRARATGSAAHFVRGDYERLDFADYDVVFAYLSPAAMAALWRKARAEMRPATMLVSYEFNIAAKAPDKTVAATPLGPPLYVWYF